MGAAWRTAGEILRVSVQAPYVFVDARGREFPCLAFLPEFGGPRGMIVEAIEGPDFNTDTALAVAASEAGVYCSFVNPEQYAVFEEETFKEALRDWGFFGRPTARPLWC